jgi:hypothetical protein
LSAYDVVPLLLLLLLLLMLLLLWLLPCSLCCGSRVSHQHIHASIGLAGLAGLDLSTSIGIV